LTGRGMPHLARALLGACLRSCIQLYLLGALVLTRLLATTHLPLVMAWIVGVGLVAAHQAQARLEYSYTKLTQHLILAILGSVLSVLGVATATGMLGEIVPWFRPHTVIPVAGMVRFVCVEREFRSFFCRPPNHIL
jgi:ABC-type iron transport system FetAB permease component